MIRKKKVSWSDCVKLILISVIILAYYNGFYLFPIIKNAAIIILIYCLCSIFFARGKICVSKYTGYVFSLLIWFLIQSVLTALVYKETTFNIIRYNYYFIEVLLVFVLEDYIKDKKKLNSFINILLYSYVFYSILLLVQYFVFANTHVYIMNIEGMVSSKNGMPRFIGGLMIHALTTMIMIGLLADNYFKNRKKSIVYIAVILGMAAQFLFMQTRMIEIILILVVLINVWKMKSRHRWVDVVVKSCLVLLFIFLCVLDSGLLDRFIVNTNEISFYARFGAFRYFIECLKDNPIFGIGLITDSVDGVGFILHGNSGIFYASDCGWIGLTFRLGIFGGIWYIYSIYKLWRLKSRSLNNENFINSCLVFGMMSLLTNSLMDHYSMASFPIMIVLSTKLIEYENKG